jgi:FixJ family two-component response regulator
MPGLKLRMPLVFVVAEDWKLRSAVRAELRERGIDALGMDCADAAGSAIAQGQMPAAVVLEGVTAFLVSPAIQQLISRIPTVLIASRTEKIPLTCGNMRTGRGAVLYRPVLVGEIVSRVIELLRKGEAA